MPRAYMKTLQFPRQQSGMKNKKEEKEGEKKHERFKVTQEGTLARSNAADDRFVTS